MKNNIVDYNILDRIEEVRLALEGYDLYEMRDLTLEEEAQMYALKAKYLVLLGDLERSGRQILASIPSEERTLSNLKKVGMPFVQEALGLESQCNGEVENLLKDLKQELASLDADTTIVETMRQAYHAEKRLKKAYYLSLVS